MSIFESVDELGNTPFIQMVQSRDIGAIARYISNNQGSLGFADTNFSQMNCFHFVGSQNPKFIFELFKIYDDQINSEKQITLTQKDCNGNSPLYTAICFDNLALFKALVHRGAPILSFKEGGTWKELLRVLLEEDPVQILSFIMEDPSTEYRFKAELKHNLSFLLQEAKTVEQMLTLRKMLTLDQPSLMNSCLDNLDLPTLHSSLSNLNYTPLANLTYQMRTAKIAEKISAKYMDSLDEFESTSSQYTNS